MGCSASEPIHIINSVDQQLLDAQEEDKYQHKILLLGAGESGKSTVVKQIKMIWKVGGGPSDKEKQEYILAIRRNAIEAIQTLLEVIVLLFTKCFHRHQYGMRINPLVAFDRPAVALHDCPLKFKVAVSYNDDFNHAPRL